MMYSALMDSLAQITIVLSHKSWLLFILLALSNTTKSCYIYFFWWLHIFTSLQAYLFLWNLITQG